MSALDYSYIPLVGVRPAEMRALEETRASTKQVMLPYITLQPWVGARSFEATLVRVQNAFSSRPMIVDLTDEISARSTRRPVHDTIDELRDPTDGYRNWYEFIEENENFIPALQLRDPTLVAAQIPRAVALNRGLVVKLTAPMLPNAAAIARLLTGFSDQREILFIIDLERQGRDILTKAASISAYVSAIKSVLPNVGITVCASTFPESFVSLEQQEIFERRFYDVMRPVMGPSQTVYCDRASVRAERQVGGGGAPAPRIDNALATRWRFYRESDEEDRETAYQLAAEAATTCADWSDLGIWGTNKIKTTASGASGAIGSPITSTAVRINIHLHVQAVGPEPASAEEEWVD